MKKVMKEVADLEKELKSMEKQCDKDSEGVVKTKKVTGNVFKKFPVESCDYKDLSGSLDSLEKMLNGS